MMPSVTYVTTLFGLSQTYSPRKDLPKATRVPLPQDAGGLALLGAVEFLVGPEHTGLQVAPPGLQKVEAMVSKLLLARPVVEARAVKLGGAKVQAKAAAKGLAKVLDRVVHKVPRANGLHIGLRLIPAMCNFAVTFIFEAIVQMALTAPGVTSAPISP